MPGWGRFHPCNRVIGTEGQNSSAGSRRRGSSPPDSTSPFNVTLPGQAANCQSDDGGLGGDAWRDSSPNWESGREVIGAPSPPTFGPAPLTGRALPDQHAPPISHGGSTHSGFALLARHCLPPLVRSESRLAPRRTCVTPSEYLEHDCKGFPLPGRGIRHPILPRAAGSHRARRSTRGRPRGSRRRAR